MHGPLLNIGIETLLENEHSVPTISVHSAPNGRNGDWMHFWQLDSKYSQKLPIFYDQKIHASMLLMLTQA